LQHGYEEVIPTVAGATAGDVEALRERLTRTGDPRDVLTAGDSLRKLPGIGLLEL
jgi:hypothetical protein